MTDHVQLFDSQSGQPSARIVFSDGTVRHLHSMVDPTIENKQYEKLSWWGDVIIFTGTGLGYHIANRVTDIPPASVIIAIDFYDELLAYCREHVFSGLPNSIIFLSAKEPSSAICAAQARIKTGRSLSVQVIKHPASYAAHEDYYSAVIKSLCAAKPSPGRSTPPRRAVMFFGNFFVEQEALNAMHCLGIETTSFMYNQTRPAAEYADQLQRIMQTTRPDFVLSINMKGFDGRGDVEEITHRFGIPLIVWFVDDPRPILMHRTAFIRNTMLAACWERGYMAYLRDAGFSSVIHAPLAVDPDLFNYAGTISPTVNVGFIGSAMVDRFTGKIREKFLWSDALEPLAEAVSEGLLEHPSMEVPDEIRSRAKEMGVALPFSDIRNTTWLATYCIHRASMKKRKRVVEGLLPQGIETFGDPEGWTTLLGPAVRTHPNIDYRHMLRDAYRAIRCNVNITSCQMPTAVNQRVFDIPCCGGFVLSDNQPDLQEFFDIGTEAVCYDSIKDCAEKLRFFCVHDAPRQAIIQAARTRILREHTYVHRIKQILTLLQ